MLTAILSSLLTVHPLTCRAVKIKYVALGLGEGLVQYHSCFLCLFTIEKISIT